MPEFNFSPEQRLILAVLCDLYKQPNQREFDPSLILDAISGGHDWAIDWKYGGLFPETIDRPDEVRFVADVLDMWRFIESGYAQLSEAEKKEVQDAIPFLEDGPQFVGFDGNNETTHHFIAKMMVEQLKRFSEFEGRSLNSHAPKVQIYGRMLKRWPEIRATLGRRGMSSQQLIELLSREN